jgi:hypothetical protein
VIEAEAKLKTAQSSVELAKKRGDGSLNGQPAIVVMVNKQPQNDTSTVTKAVEKAISIPVLSLWKSQCLKALESLTFQFLAKNFIF